MKHFASTVRNMAILGAVSAAAFISGCATLEQNMAASEKQYVVPGKVMHVADMNNYPFCEIGLITGTSESNAVLNIWNTTSVGRLPAGQVRPDRGGQGRDDQAATGPEGLAQPEPSLDVGRDLGLQGRRCRDLKASRL